MSRFMRRNPNDDKLINERLTEIMLEDSMPKKTQVSSESTEHAESGSSVDDILAELSSKESDKDVLSNDVLSDEFAKELYPDYAPSSATPLSSVAFDNFDDIQDSDVKSDKPSRFIRILHSIFPMRGDAPLEITRKCVFFTALIVLVCSLTYIVNTMLWVPWRSDVAYSGIRSLYNPNDPRPPSEDGTLAGFDKLSAINPDIRGWISYYDAQKSWLEIDYPVMLSTDNKYYLNHDFKHSKNPNGVPFFDMANNVSSPDAQNKVLIVYGHNMATGKMFSGLNQMLNNRNRARSAPTINLSTLYENNEYLVFAVMLANTEERDGPVFPYLQTNFGSDKQFMEFVDNIRARSIYEYKGVDIKPSDDLLILSTCTSKSGAHFEDGRCVIVARRVRKGESAASRAADIVNNENVIMPRAWYENQNLDLHAFYTDPNYVIPSSWDGVSENTTAPPVTDVGDTTAATAGGTAGATRPPTSPPATTAPTPGPTNAPTDPTNSPPDPTNPPPTNPPLTNPPPATTATAAPTEATTAPTEPPEPPDDGTDG